MNNVVAVIQAVAALLPAIRDAIKLIEDALPEPGQGEMKLAAVKGMLQAAYEAVGSASLTFDQIWPTVRSVITTLVAFYNASGVFKKGQ